MAIGIRIKLLGVTQEQFDHAHDHANPDRTPPKGLLFQASGPIDGGWGIIDFWESRDDFDAFAPRVVLVAVLLFVVLALGILLVLGFFEAFSFLP